MNKILLSIKPEYVKHILAGKKKYEFRRKLPQKPIQSIVIYATSPSMMVVGEAEVISSMAMDPLDLWGFTKQSAGITKDVFLQYFLGCNIAYAYELGEIMIYDPPKSLLDIGVYTAPQSFVYL
ncbi:MAG: hypothetical protein EP149_06950 [Phascolarctobacterium sp.]|uniref:ASCH domain-containing protein n=1 Tax=uncultured Phascolarctobacterium sp. TaxID=512296 RepID=UPI001327AA5D|nr:ASCH domain-containing protein [Phascolarctobacterium sp.]MUU07415.1 hypothetical protein [Phascolarctobacterium sp.]MUU17056.1 hypothetical protein [Phascolarctobacterium sp.]